MSYKLHVYVKCERSLPRLPGIPLRMPARLGRDLRLLLWCIFSMDMYLFFICAGITRFSKSLLWILGISSMPSFFSSASFISWCVKALVIPRIAVHRTQARRKSMSETLSANNCGTVAQVWLCLSRDASLVPYIVAALPVVRTLSMGAGTLIRTKVRQYSPILNRISKWPYFKQQQLDSSAIRIVEV